MQADLQVAESRSTKVLDIGMTSIRYSAAMNKKKQPNVYPLRFDNKSQRELVRRAAKVEGRSMNNYILRCIIQKAAADIQSQAESALSKL